MIVLGFFGPRDVWPTCLSPSSNQVKSALLFVAHEQLRVHYCRCAAGTLHNPDFLAPSASVTTH